MKYVGVLYLNEESKMYTGRQYTYMTNLPLQNLDRVICPVGNRGELKRACVIDDNMPVELIPENIIPILKSITRYDEGE